MNSELPQWDAEIEREGAERGLWEAALRLIGVAPAGAAFPDSRAGLGALLEKASSRRTPTRLGFEIEDDAALPRYCGGCRVWVRRDRPESLRLRVEYPWLRALITTLRIDGTLSEPRVEIGFGVPDEELTAQAREDLAAVQRRAREAKEEEENDLAELPDPPGFKGAELQKVVAAPPQEAGGLVVTTVELYADGVLVNYLLPSADPEAFAHERWPDDAQWAAAFPTLALSDDIGTDYGDPEPTDDQTFAGQLTRAAQAFGTSVPAAARHLIVEAADRRVEVEIGAR